jgi:tetratricopeptide (TPR) repeat protein
MNVCKPRALFMAGLCLAAGCQHPSRPSVAPVPASGAAVVAPPEPARTNLVRLRTLTGRPAAEALSYLLRSAGRTTEVSVLAGEIKELEDTSMVLEEAVAAAARRQGVWVHAHYGTPAMLQERLAAGVPVLVQFVPPTDRPGGAFLVVSAYHASRNMYRVLNARGVELDQPVPDLDRAWAASQRWMMIACRPERGRWPLSPFEHLSRMQFYDGAGHHDWADKDASQALLKGGRNPEVWVVLGARERSRGRAAAAEALWRRALAHEGTYVRAANNLAYLLAEQGQNLGEAEQLVRGAAQVEPTNPRVLHTLAYVLQVQDRWTEALPWYEKAWKQSVGQPDAVRREMGFYLIRACVHENRSDRAAQVLAALRNQEPGLLVPSDLADLMPGPGPQP